MMRRASRLLFYTAMFWVTVAAAKTDPGIDVQALQKLSLIHISEPTRLKTRSRMPSSA